MTSEYEQLSTSTIAGFGSPIRAPRTMKEGDTFLSRYFRFIGSHKSLTADEELEAARALADLERTLWEAILSDNAAAEMLAERLGDDKERKLKHEEEVFQRARAVIRGYVDAVSDPGKKRHAGALVDLRLESSVKLLEIDEDRAVVASTVDALRRFNRPQRSLKSAAKHQRAVESLAHQVKQAKNAFIQENLGLVVNVAKRYHVEKLSLADLIQEGNLGLIRAVDKFDYKRGFRFSTYASWWIRSYISRAIVRKSNTVRIPEYMLRDRNRIKRTEEANRMKLGRTPNEEELAKALGLSEKRLKRTRKHDVAFVESLDREVPGSDSQRYIDFLADEDERGPFENAEFNAWIRDIPRTLDKLSVTERFVICWRFGLLDGEEMTLQEIGKCLNLSRERIRQIQEEALLKLRANMEVDAA